MTRAVPVLVLALAGCTIGDEAAEQPPPAVIAVKNSIEQSVGYLHTSVGVCSGTLIAPRVVVTAAHCGVGQTFELDGFTTDVVDTQANPGWGGNPDPYDIAMMLLRDPAPGPVAPYDTTPASAGTRLAFVGYGLIGEGMGGVGEKRTGIVRVEQVGDMIITRGDPSSPCGGDSGGALFDGSRLVGVTSGAFCKQNDLGFFVRVDTHAGGFIAQWMAAWGFGPRACGMMQFDDALPAGYGFASCNGRFVLSHQTDGNVVLYGQDGAIWATNTYGQESTELRLQSDGNLVLYGPYGALWATDTYGHQHPFLIVGDDGVMTLYEDIVTPLWSTR